MDENNNNHHRDDHDEEGEEEEEDDDHKSDKEDNLSNDKFEDITNGLKELDMDHYDDEDDDGIYLCSKSR